MPMMDADFSQDYEDRPVPEGLYNLRIIKAEEKVSKNSSADMIQCILEIEGVEGASNIFHYLVMPIGSKQSAERGVEEDDSNKVRNKMRSLTRFLTLFGIKYERRALTPRILSVHQPTMLWLSRKRPRVGTRPKTPSSFRRLATSR